MLLCGFYYQNKLLFSVLTLNLSDKHDFFYCLEVSLPQKCKTNTKIIGFHLFMRSHDYAVGIS